MHTLVCSNTVVSNLFVLVTTCNLQFGYVYELCDKEKCLLFRFHMNISIYLKIYLDSRLGTSVLISNEAEQQDKAEFLILTVVVTVKNTIKSMFSIQATKMC